MLRLRPSEITLTAADVEETRRRMVRKQAAVHLAIRSARGLKPQTRPVPEPRLRRGPEHSRDDAITCLGDIPILRPHQAVSASTGGDYEAGLADSPEHHSEASIYDLPAEKTVHAPNNNASEALTSPSMQFPFQSAPPRLTSTEDTEEVYSTPPKYSGFGQQRTSTSEDYNEGAGQSRIFVSTDGLTEDSRTSVPSSSLHQTHAVHSARQQDTEHGTSTRHDSPIQTPSIVGLQGIFSSPEEFTSGEHHILPRKEPHERIERLAHVTTNVSSFSDPSQPGSRREPGRPQLPSTTEDVFWTPLISRRSQPEASDSIDGSGSERRRPSLEERIRSGSHHISELVQDHYRGLFGRLRASQATHDSASSGLDVSRHTLSQRFSEASSSSSLPYSLYELPVSRHSSSMYSRAGQLLQSQYDGAAPSRDVSRGAYFSIRSSQIHLRPSPVRASSHSSPNLTAGWDHQGISSAPARPYSHAPIRQPRTRHQQAITENNTQIEPGSSTDLVDSRDFVGQDRDAASAAQRDLSSPLEILEQRASSYLSQISTALHTASGSSQRSSEGSSVSQYQVADFDEQQQQQQQQQQQHRTSGYEGLRLGSRHSARSRMPTPCRSPGTRAGQRSSENISVGAQVTLERIQTGPAARQGSIRGDRIPISLIPLSFSVPQTSSPRDLSNRPQLHSPYQLRYTMRSPQGFDDDRNVYSFSPASHFQGRRHMSQRHDTPTLRHQRSIAYESEHPYRNPARILPGLHFHHEHHEQRRDYQPRPVAYPHSERASVAPTLVQGAETQRTVVNRVATSRRRITPQQEDQENTGDAEAGLMREELAAVGSRYAESGQELDVMDETPPRLGRFERQALG